MNVLLSFNRERKRKLMIAELRKEDEVVFQNTVSSIMQSIAFKHVNQICSIGTIRSIMSKTYMQLINRDIGVFNIYQVKTSFDMENNILSVTLDILDSYSNEKKRMKIDIAVYLDDSELRRRGE